MAQIRSTPAALLLLDLVREYLDHFELDYTSSVLHAEARVDELEGDSINRADLRARLGLTVASPTAAAEPVLAHLLAAFQQSVRH